MNADEIRTYLRRVGPRGSWLRISRVERLLKLDRWALTVFLDSHQPTERGSTRHQTVLPSVLHGLREDGIFFESGHVAIDRAGGNPPPWAGPKYSNVEEPLLLAANKRSPSPGPVPEDAHRCSRSPSDTVLTQSDKTTVERPGQHAPTESTGAEDGEKTPKRSVGRSSSGGSACQDEVEDRLPAAQSDDDRVQEEGRGKLPCEHGTRAANGESDSPGGISSVGATRAWSVEIATDPVFQKLMSTNTYNHFFRPGELVDVIDEEEDDIRRTLKMGSTWRRSEEYELFLRSFGIISRKSGGNTAWCLLGIGSVHMSLRTSDHIAHVLSSEPKGALLRFGTKFNLRSDGPWQLPERMSLTQCLEQSLELYTDISGGVCCRRCGKSAPAGKWWFVRLESLATPLLRPNVTPELGIAFRCSCSAINIGLPLPLRRRRGTVWSVADEVVEAFGSTCPAFEKAPTCTGRRHGRERRSAGGDRDSALFTPDGRGGRAARRTPSTPSTTEERTPAGVVRPNGAPPSASASGETSEKSTARLIGELAARRRSSSEGPSSPASSFRSDRGVHTTINGLLHMCTAVHKQSSGCPGPLNQTGASYTPIDHFVFSAECESCGAVFGRVSTERPTPRSIALGVLLAGGNFVQFENCLELSDIQSFSSRTLIRAQEPVLVAIDKVFDEEFKKHRENIKLEPGRDRIKVAKAHHYFAAHWEKLLDEAKSRQTLGVQEGAASNATYTDIATCLMVAANSKGEAPGFEVDGEDVWVYPVEVSLDGSFRNRNHSAHGINVVTSVKRKDKDHRGLKDVVLDQVTFGRHIGQDAPLQPICALSRDGGKCHVHGKAMDWAERARPGPDASEADEDAAQRLRNGNCYSSTCLPSPLSAPATEPLGVNVLCLRLLLQGFWVTAFSHDQDAGVGQLVRTLFPNALECLDRSHIQKNLKKAVAKIATGNAARVNRLFAWVVPQARDMASACADGSVSRSEAFTELFSHIVMHLQGDHQFCTQGCDGHEDVDSEEVRVPEGLVQPDIFDIDELRTRNEGPDEGGGEIVGAAAGAAEDRPCTGEPGDQNRGREGDRGGGRAIGTTVQQPERSGVMGALTDATVAGGTKKKKQTLKACLGSKFTAASLRKTLGETIALGVVKGKTWNRVLTAVAQFRRESEEREALSDCGSGLLRDLELAVTKSRTKAKHVVEIAETSRAQLDEECQMEYKYLTAKEKREKEVHLGNISGPWQMVPSADEECGTTDGPARLCTVTTVQAAKEGYIKACQEVRTVEEAFRKESGKAFFVDVLGSSQVERSSVRHQAWAESRQWSWFSHCCNGLGGNLRASQPCPACDTHVAVVTTCVRASAFMHDLGTNYLESLNGTISAKATKRCDFKTSHWGRAQVAMMNRVLPIGAVGVANLVRQRLDLGDLSDRAAHKTQAHERRNLKVVSGQAYLSPEEKKQRTVRHYKAKEVTTARIAEFKSKHDASARGNPITPFGQGTHGLAAVRAQLNAATTGLSEEAGGDDDDPRPGQGGRPKGKGKKRKRSAQAIIVPTLPEYTAAGSNVEKNAEVATEVRMGGVKSGGICMSCLKGNVGREFLVGRKHARSGKKICPKIREEWQQHIERVRKESASRNG